MIVMLKRELKSHLHSLLSYAFICLLLVFAGLFMILYQMIMQSSNFSYTISYLKFTLLALLPLLTFRSFSREWENGTYQLLNSLPFTTANIIIGKLLSTCAVFGISVFPLLFFPLLMRIFGPTNMVASYAGILSFLLFGIALITLYSFISSLFSKPWLVLVIDYVFTIVLLLLYFFNPFLTSSASINLISLLLINACILYVIWESSHNYILSLVVAAVLYIPAIILFFINSKIFITIYSRLISVFAILNHFEELIYGIFDISSLVYCVCFAAFFVFLIGLSWDKHRLN